MFGNPDLIFLLVAAFAALGLGVLVLVGLAALIVYSMFAAADKDD